MDEDYRRVQKSAVEIVTQALPLVGAWQMAQALLVRDQGRVMRVMPRLTVPVGRCGAARGAAVEDVTAQPAPWLHHDGRERDDEQECDDNRGVDEEHEQVIAQAHVSVDVVVEVGRHRAEG